MTQYVNDLVAILLLRLLLLLLLSNCFDRNVQRSEVSSLDIEAAAAPAAVTWSLFSNPTQNIMGKAFFW